MFRPLWWRTWRYLELDITTQDQPLVIEDSRPRTSGIPSSARRYSTRESEDINRILDVGWRTASLCAHETYMDCPYYEQLQYVGDTRDAMPDFDFQYRRCAADAQCDRPAQRLAAERRGTMSRYPTRLEQYIPGFSLWWIGMVHDYWWYVTIPRLSAACCPACGAELSSRGIRRRMGRSRLPWWRYFDWVPSWPNGDAPQEADGIAAVFDLQLLMASAGRRRWRKRSPPEWRRSIVGASTLRRPPHAVLGRGPRDVRGYSSKKMSRSTPTRWRCWATWCPANRRARSCCAR